MAKITQREKTVQPAIIMRTYTDVELEDFGKKLERFYSDYKAIDGNKYRLLDKKGLAVAFGALDRYGAVILEDVFMDGNQTSYYKRPTRLEQFENLLDQYSSWKHRKKGFEAKKIEGLEELAKAVTVDKIYDEF